MPVAPLPPSNWHITFILTSFHRLLFFLFHFAWINLQKSSSEQAENDVAEDIAYAPQQNDGAEEYEAQQQIQYVTPQQYEQQCKKPTRAMGFVGFFFHWSIESI